MSLNLSREMCEAFLNNTTKFNVKGEYQALTDILSSNNFQLAPLAQTKNLLKGLAEKTKDQETANRFDTLDEMKNEAKKFFETLGGEWQRVAQMLDSPETSIKIKTQKIGYNQGYATMDSENKSQHHIEVTLDAAGMVTLCQTMANAYVMTKVREDEIEKNKQKEHLIERTTNIFIGNQIMKYMMKKCPDMTPQEQDKMQVTIFKELIYDIGSLETDRALYKVILNSNENSFGTLLNTPNNLSPENFSDTMDHLTEHLDADKQELIENRIKDIAMKGNTSRYIQAGVALQLSTLENRQNNYTVDQLLETAENTYVRTHILGENEKDVINENSNAIFDPTESTEAILKDENMANKVNEYINENQRQNISEEEMIRIRQKQS